MTGLIFLIGTIMGSFFNVCIYRIPRGKSISYPPSHCNSCNHRLNLIDLLPLLSYIFLRGRCRYCDRPISIQYPLIELLTGALYVALYIRYGPSIEFAFYAILVSILIIVSAIDIYITIIPPTLLTVGSVLALIFSLLGWGQGILNSIYGALAGAGIMFLIDLIALLIFKKEGMGGGDIKLMGMAGLFMGPKYVLLSILFTIYVSGIIFIILLTFKKIERTDYIPFAPFLSLGILISLFLGNQILSWYLSTFI